MQAFHHPLNIYHPATHLFLCHNPRDIIINSVSKSAIFLLTGPTKSVLQAMLANLEGEDEMPPQSTPAPPIINVPPPVRLIGSRAAAEIPPIASISVPSNVAGGGKGASPPATTADEPFESALGLGELASLTVSNEAEALSYEVSVQDSLQDRSFVEEAILSTLVFSFCNVRGGGGRGVLHAL